MSWSVLRIWVARAIHVVVFGIAIAGFAWLLYCTTQVSPWFPVGFIGFVLFMFGVVWAAEVLREERSRKRTLARNRGQQ